MRLTGRNPISEWLRSIRRHSARREVTVWTRAMDTALFASPILGILLALLLHHAALRAETTVLAPGAVERDTPGGAMRATIVEEGTNHRWSRIPVGQFWIERTEEFGGWPMPTTVRRRPALILVTVFGEPTQQRRPSTDADAEFVAAVGRAVDLGGADTAWLREILSQRPVVTSRWALVANTALCWIAVHLLLAVLVQVARFVAWRISIHRERRRRDAMRRGTCLNCGYDIRANLWSERCPECGAPLE